MDEFTRPRNSKTNVDNVLEQRTIISDDDYGDEEEEEEEDFDHKADEELNNSDNEEDEEESLIENEGTKTENSNPPPPPPKKSKVKTRQESKDKDDDNDMKLMKDVVQNIVERRSAKRSGKVPEDPEDLYGRSIAIELRKFDERERYMIKHEINEILFKYTMSRFHEQPRQTLGQLYNQQYIPNYHQMQPSPLFNLQNSCSSVTSPASSSS